jgi:DNA-directed RNA polymerase specialized sigma24 family protein
VGIALAATVREAVSEGFLVSSSQDEELRKLAAESTPTAVAVEARAREVRAILTRAMARACPAEHASLREDLVQAALLRVLEIERDDEANAVRSSSYLWRVAYSVAIDELRRLRRSEAVTMPTVEDETMPEPVAPASSQPGLGTALRHCLGRLAEPRRLSVMLHLQGFHSEEAARLLGWDLKRVRNLIFRGMSDLRDCLRAKGCEP